jgi:hypothetical protein
MASRRVKDYMNANNGGGNFVPIPASGSSEVAAAMSKRHADVITSVKESIHKLQK